MTLHNITGAAALVASRLTAFVAGCIFVAGAAALLFEDVVLTGAAVKLPHVLTVVTLSGTLLVGHLMGEAWRGGHYLRSLSFGLLFGVGTALVVYQSSGKQAEHNYQSEAEADFAAQERARITPRLAEAEEMESKAMKKVDDDCVKGKNSKGHCDGLRTTLSVYQAAVKGHKADIEKLGPPKPVAPEAENIANVAAVLGADKAKVKAAAVLVVPFIRTILFELGGLWCLGFAFRPLRQATRQPAATETDQTSFSHPMLLATRATVLSEASNAGAKRDNRGNGGDSSNRRNPKPDTPRNAGPFSGRTFSKAEAERDIVTLLATGATVDEQNDLAGRWSVHKGTVSKWLNEWRGRGLVPAAQRVGRCHRLAAVD